MCWIENFDLTATELVWTIVKVLVDPLMCAYAELYLDNGANYPMLDRRQQRKVSGKVTLTTWEQWKKRIIQNME